MLYEAVVAREILPFNGVRYSISISEVVEYPDIFRVKEQVPSAGRLSPQVEAVTVAPVIV